MIAKSNVYIKLSPINFYQINVTILNYKIQVAEIL